MSIWANPKIRIKNNSISSVIKQKRRCNNLTLPTADTKDSRVKKDSDFEKRIKLISTKLDGGNGIAGIRLAGSDDYSALCNTEN